MRAFCWLLILFSPIFAVANSTPEVTWYFPQHEILGGFYDSDFMPTKTPHPPHPLFWTSRARAGGGGTLNYQWLLYHTHKYFSVNLALGLSDWMIHSQSEWVMSFYFVVRVWIFRTETFSPYFDWSMGGPSLLSSQHFAQANLGAPFIFQDFMGFGAMIGRQHHFDVNVNIMHYSNGDLFVHNDGWDVPLIVSLGYCF